jgi:transposase-like protein
MVCICTFLDYQQEMFAKALSFLNIVKRCHVSIWNWIQKYQPKRISSQRNKIDELIVDEAVIKVGSELIWLWVAIDSKNKQILAQNISPKREACLLQSAFCQILFENMESIRFQQMEGLGIHKPVSF